MAEKKTKGRVEAGREHDSSLNLGHETLRGIKTNSVQGLKEF